MLEDLDVFMQDFGQDVTHAGGAFRALLDTSDQSAFDAVVHGTHVLRYASSESIADGAALTIGGASYRVAAPPRRVDDGEWSVAELVKQ